MIGGASEPDYFRNVLKAAEAVPDMRVVGWLEYGMMSGTASANRFQTAAKNRGWVQGFYQQWNWLDVLDPEVNNFLVSMCQDISQNYKHMPRYGGIQLDDHLGAPLYKNTNRASAALVELSRLVRRISQAVGADFLSLSPLIEPNSKRDLLADWPQWMRDFLAYEVIPQVYRSNTASLRDALAVQLRAYSDRSRMIAGLRCNGDPPTSFVSFNEQAAHVQSLGLKGISVWYAKCFKETYAAQFDSPSSTWRVNVPGLGAPRDNSESENGDAESNDNGDAESNDNGDSGPPLRSCPFALPSIRALCAPSQECVNSGFAATASQSCAAGESCCAYVVCEPPPSARRDGTENQCAQAAYCRAKGGTPHPTVAGGWRQACSSIPDRDVVCCSFPRGVRHDESPAMSRQFRQSERGTLPSDSASLLPSIALAVVAICPVLL